MKEWFFSLSERERLMVGGGAVLAVVLLFYGLIWNPIVNSGEALQSDLSRARTLASEMKDGVKEVKRLEGSGEAATGLPPGQSLLSLVDSTIKRAGMGEQMERVKPEGENEVQLWLDNVSFDKMITWLEDLGKRHGVAVKSTSIEQAQAAGTVRANLVLQGG